ncbi:MAG: dTDP-4-amino-4,6-dideoxygalactose transaminase [Aurantimicrobium sp.]|nr:dTDP-4-amino-4,6-dideoxygalactose transaminase [Aurantimicrobium sp.]
MTVGPILFSRPFHSPAEIQNVADVLATDHVHGDGPFTASATARLKQMTGAAHALLTTSGTHALEMAVRLVGVKPGDEVILPSFTFSSGATAIVAAGATPVFVDMELATGNIAADQIEAAITDRTRAIEVMHYGGVPVDMSSVGKLAARYQLRVIEDNAHGLGVTTPAGVLGTIGDVGIQSFHDTKNVHCGEGGAVLFGTDALTEPAEVMREKGTNRSKFLRGQVDKYTWVDWGSSYLPSELNAAVLDAQLASFDTIQAARFEVWNAYREQLADWAATNGVTLMEPPGGVHAAHVFWLLLPTPERRDEVLASMRAEGVQATFHYVPLHSSPAGQAFGRTSGTMVNTDDFAARQLRLPLWAGMSEADIARVVATLKKS